MTKAEKELADLEAVFAALSHASRRQILLVLKMRGGEMTAGQIVERFSCRWPTITRHLKQLESAGLVTVRKDGRERIYSLNQARLTAVATRWLHWFNQ